MGKTARRRNFVILPESQHSNDIAIKSKSPELENWKPFNVYHVVPDEGEPHITTICLIMEKIINNESTIKAQLVARSFNKEDYCKTTLCYHVQTGSS